MTPAQIIEVVSGFEKGRKVQRQWIDNDVWADDPSPNWDFPNKNYRLAPEPLVLWVNIGRLRGFWWFKTKEKAADHAEACGVECFSHIAVRMVETPEEMK